MSTKNKAGDASVQEVKAELIRLTTHKITFCVLGRTPIILNRMTEKAKHQLLLGGVHKTAADKAASLKHNPIEEFRASPYISTDRHSPTLLCHLAVAFKRALCGAALDMPGAKKAQMLRLVHASQERVPLYGVPRLLMSVVRSADLQKTPDIRTRAILPEWGCYVTIEYTPPLATESMIMKLMAAAGFSQGVADWRPEKGAGNYGQFEIVNEDDPRFQAVLLQGRAAQEEAMANPVPYDLESEEMLEWFSAEVKRRGAPRSPETTRRETEEDA